MGQMSILIVDDEAAMTLALESFFGSKGYKVSRAFYGDQAIAQIDKERPAVVILDLQMPGVDGITVLEKIRSSYPEVKTLVITGYGERYQQALDRLKPDAVRLNPISLEDLTPMVESLLGQKKPAPSAKGKVPSKIRILFVGGVEELYKQVLKPHFEAAQRPVQYETAIAKGKEEIFRQLEQFRPHLVLLDGNRLPIGIDAGQLAAEMSGVATPPVEVIFHTFRVPQNFGVQIPEDQLQSLENSIQQVAERHRLLPTSHGG